MRSALLSVLLAAVTGLLVAVGAGLGAQLTLVAVTGVLLGAVAALADGGAARRPVAALAGAFTLGIVIAWVSYAVRAAVLPDVTAGRVVAAAGLVLVLGLVATVAKDRLPMIGMFAGAAALIGGYEAAYRVDPSAFLGDSPMYLSAVLLSGAAGFLVAVLVGRTPASTPISELNADEDTADEYTAGEDIVAADPVDEAQIALPVGNR